MPPVPRVVSEAKGIPAADSEPPSPGRTMPVITSMAFKMTAGAMFRLEETYFVARACQILFARPHTVASWILFLRSPNLPAGDGLVVRHD